MSDSAKKLSAQQRLSSLFDDGVFYELDAVSGREDGAIAGYGSVGGASVYAFCQDSSVDNGVLDKRAIRKLEKAYDMAAKTGCPVVTIYDSLGVNVSDAFGSLENASLLTGKIAQLSGVVPQISVVVGNCGGFYALAATMSDICVMSADANLYLTSAFNDNSEVSGVGSAEYAAKAGAAAVVCEDEASAIAKAADIVKLLPLNNLAPLPVFDFEAPAASGVSFESIADVDTVVELFAGVAENVNTVLATIGGTPCGILDINGEICSKGSAKAAKLVQLCDSFNLPVVVLMDCTGFVNSAANDVAGGIVNAAKLAHVMASATTAKITVIKGSAVGSAFAVLAGKGAGADVTLAVASASVSALNARASVDILWRDRITTPADIDKLAKEFCATNASASAAAEAGLVDVVVADSDVRGSIITAIDMLASKRVSTLSKKHGNMPF